MLMPPWYEVPPAGYGGLERVCASLIDGLIDLGHHVTLFGAGTRTGTRARFVSTDAQLQYPRLLEAMPELVHVTRVNEMLAEEPFDIVHDHTTVGPITAGYRDIPTVVTVHSCPVGEVVSYLSRVDNLVSLIAISHSQRRVAPDLAWHSTIHHGIEVPGPVKTQPTDGPVLWLGRFAADKGPDLAIEACRKANLPLVLAGKANQKDEWQYLDEVIRPMLGPDVELVLNGGRDRTEALLFDARSLLLPIRWEEPFGMVMIEAMAKGTPVVALRRGSVPEVVLHGRTGMICSDEADLPAALHEVASLDPGDCADHVRSTFSVPLMASRYERVYRRILAERAADRSVVDRYATPAGVGSFATVRPARR
ncbi:MAG TPA: glycosyltransferase [Micromonosporaceae bacterium]|jgi:glycosyltransferase involved in cell wall biosynthesis